MKKILSGIIALTMIIALLSGAISVPRAQAVITNWYVDPSGTDDATHGTGTGTLAFKTIQYAIDAATAGDTINVAAGTYIENPAVTKALTLIGVSSATVTVQAALYVGDVASTASVFTVTASNVNISGFTAKGADDLVTGDETPAGIYLGAGVANCNIHDNILTLNVYGIILVDAENSTTPGNNTFTNNTATVNSCSGIEMQHTYGNTFTSNTASSNAKYGFKLDSSRYNTFTSNTASSNTRIGFYLATGEGVGSNNNTFTSNTASLNSQYGFKINAGTGNTLTDNTFQTNTLAGLRLGNSSADTTTDFTATGNTTGTGQAIGVDIVGTLSNVNITENKFTSNTLYVSNNGTGTLNAIHNWWGSADLAVIAPLISGSVTFKPYYIQVEMTSLSDIKAITAFDFNGLTPHVIGVVNETAHTIALTVPYGTTVTALIATFTTTGASLKVGDNVQTSGTTPNTFVMPLTYTVTAVDGSTQNYIVTVTVASGSTKVITAFDFNGLTPHVIGVVNETAHTIALTVPYGTTVTALVATFTTTGASVKVGVTAQVSGTTPNDFTSPVTYIVTALDATTQNYIVTVTVTSESAKAITAFSFNAFDPDVTGVINETAHTIALTVPYGTTDVTALVATFAHTGTSVKVGVTPQVSGTTPNNFTSPVTYIVTAGDLSTQSYTVTVTVAANSDSIGVFRPSNNGFFLRSSTGTVAAPIFLGDSLDLPIIGDWNGDGADDIGVFRPSNMGFYLRSSTGTVAAPIYLGNSGDLPIIGDWDGNGADEIGVFRPSNNGFFLRSSTGTVAAPIYLGDSGDLPIIGDWNGDGTDDIGIFRPSDMGFYLRTGTTVAAPIYLGNSGDLPIIGDWNGDGTDDIGIFRPSNNGFYLRTGTTVAAPIYLGNSDDKPIIGKWPTT
jgi:parallel beta-helix repeat protein